MTFRDIIHGDIVIDDSDDLIVSLINTVEFQRLRKIKQLGLTYKVFPTAEHSRFTHSLGVYHLAKKAIETLEKCDEFKASKVEKRAFLVACLLHDLGHGPMSHSAENFFKYSHEAYSCAIVSEKSTSINQILLKESDGNEDFVKHVVDFIAKTHQNKMLVSLLSSSVDVDRMDYLLRDSYCCGVVYGNSENERIINFMSIHNDQLVFDEKALKSIEDFIMGRYQMFSQVYLNVKALAYEQLLFMLLQRLKKLFVDKYPFKTDITKLLPFLSGKLDVKSYLKMNDYVFMDIVEGLIYEEDEIISTYAKSFERNGLVVSTVNVDELDRYIEVEIKGGQKNAFYNDPLYIKRKNGLIVPLENISQLMEFSKKELKITVEEQVIYIEK